jgi:hypothetical protein
MYHKFIYLLFCAVLSVDASSRTGEVEAISFIRNAELNFSFPEKSNFDSDCVKFSLKIPGQDTSKIQIDTFALKTKVNIEIEVKYTEQSGKGNKTSSLIKRVFNTSDLPKTLQPLDSGDYKICNLLKKTSKAIQAIVDERDINFADVESFNIRYVIKELLYLDDVDGGYNLDLGFHQLREDYVTLLLEYYHSHPIAASEETQG